LGSASTDWFVYLQQLTAASAAPTSPKRLVAQPGATELDLRDLADACGMPVPEQLRELLLQSNGIMEQFDLGTGRGFENNLWLVDSIGELIERFSYLRPEDDDDDSHAEAVGIFFFGGPGVDGVRFGFGDGDRFPAASIVAYFPMGGYVTLMAPDFRTFFEEWIAGRLSLAGWAHRES
jgi:hypothetical protein